MGKGDIRTFSEEVSLPSLQGGRQKDVSQQGGGDQQLAETPRLQAGVAGDRQYFLLRNQREVDRVCCHSKATELAGKGACLQGESYI